MLLLILKTKITKQAIPIVLYLLTNQQSYFLGYSKGYYDYLLEAADLGKTLLYY